MRIVRWVFCSALLCALPLAEARLWTNIEGKFFEAEIVTVNSNKTVSLKTTSQEIITIPFAELIPSDVSFLENLHPVPWSQMNTLFGMKIWQDECLWDDPTDLVAKRMMLSKESKTEYIENHRAYPLGKERILQEPVYATVLYGGREYAESLLFVFSNQGDGVPQEQVAGETLPVAVVNEITKKIDDSEAQLHDTLVAVLGEPKRESIGKNTLREKVSRWDWNGHSILLVTQKGKYTMVRIVSSELGSRLGKVDKINKEELAEKRTSCVKRYDNGDVLITNIPMIDQGPKGYCGPATYERYCRYLGIPVDMYQLANLGKTRVGGGTSSYDAEKAVETILSNYGPRLEGVGLLKDINAVGKYIDQGIPLFWALQVTAEFERFANENTGHRTGDEMDSDKKDELIRTIKNELEQAEKNQINNGHLRLVVGYNKRSREIAFSDSWGPKYEVRWISIDIAAVCPSDPMTVIN